MGNQSITHTASTNIHPRASLGRNAVHSVTLANGVGSHANTCLYTQASSPRCWGLCTPRSTTDQQQHLWSLQERKHLDCNRFANVMSTRERHGSWLHDCVCVASNSNPDLSTTVQCVPATRWWSVLDFLESSAICVRVADSCCLILFTRTREWKTTLICTTLICRVPVHTTLVFIFGNTKQRDSKVGVHQIQLHIPI